MIHVAHSRISLQHGQVSGFTTKLLYVLLRTLPRPLWGCWLLGVRRSRGDRPTVRGSALWCEALGDRPLPPYHRAGCWRLVPVSVCQRSIPHFAVAGEAQTRPAEINYCELYHFAFILATLLPKQFRSDIFVVRPNDRTAFCTGQREVWRVLQPTV